MRKLYAVCFFVFLSIGYSQQTNLNPELITYPVSPEAARMATYGNIPVNLFSGQLNKSIELFDGKVGDFNMPINLNYNYAGSRVEETPSIIGLGWQLSAGGVVTREVRGFVDESPAGYYNPSVQSVLNNYFNHMNDSITQRINYYTARSLANGQFDSEADKYTLSVNGIHFSFKVGLDGTPAFLSKHNYKLEILRNVTNTQFIEGFIMTDTNANKYFFESKEINEPHSGYDSFSDVSFPTYTSSWQLSKIIINNGSVINFNYDSNLFPVINYAANLNFHRESSTEQNHHAETIETYLQSITINNITRKILKSITCPNFSIFFDCSTLNYTQLYNKITLKDASSKIIDYYDFTYDGSRNCLVKINKKNLFFYEFDYYDLGSMSGFSSGYPYNQDEWGFNNGANNSNFIFHQGSEQYYANRRPNFLSTREGALKKITYPTGGKTEIEYEQNKIEITNNNFLETNVSLLYKFKSDNSPTAPEVKEKVYTKTFDSSVVATLSHYISNGNFIDVYITKIDNGTIDGFSCDVINHILPYNTLIPHYRTICNKAVPLASPILVHTAWIDSSCANFNNCSISADSGGKFMIGSGTYEFRFRTTYNRTNDVRAEIQLDFLDTATATYVNINTSEETGGIRVKKTTDYSSFIDSEALIKNFEYGYGTKFNDRQSLQYKVLKKETCCADYNGTGFFAPLNLTLLQYNAYDISSRSFNQFIHSNIPVYYDYVKVYTTRNETFVTQPLGCSGCTGIQPSNKNWDGTKIYSYLNGVYGKYNYTYPEGYTTTTYEKPRTQLSTYPYIPAGSDLSIGVLKKNTVYSGEVVNFENKLLTEETNIYSNLGDQFYNPPSIVNNPNYPKSLKVAYKVRITDNSSIIAPYGLHDFFYFKVYKEFDNEKFLLFKDTKEYFNDQPIEKSMMIEYNDHFKQSKITTTESNSNTKTNELFYPYDSSTGAITAGMVSKNFIAPVVKVVNKKNGAVLDSYKFDFTSIPGTNLFKPDAFYKSKANDPLELRNRFKYDTKGNMISTQNLYTSGTAPNNGAPVYSGPITQIIWGYTKSQIIAKITSDQVLTLTPDIITDLQTKSDADSDAASEAILLSALNALRTNYPTALITTYTFDPLIGVTTITDPKGDQINYTYDNQNRLLWVKDKNGNKLSENEYHYKN